MPDIRSSALRSSVNESIVGHVPADLSVVTELQIGSGTSIDYSQIIMRDGEITWVDGTPEKADVVIKLASSDAAAIAATNDTSTGQRLHKQGRVRVEDPKNVFGLVLAHCMPKISIALEKVGQVA